MIIQNRRSFLRKISAGAVLLSTGGISLKAFDGKKVQKLTILHTNDTHSRIDPFPMEAGSYAGKAGVAKRMSLIKKVRETEENVLLFDSGDIFQGTPYFNYFHGELEFKMMSKLGYDAATLGNHDFDGGIDGLYQQLPNTKFPFLVSNYDFKDTIMNGQTMPYKIFNKGELKIGVFGINIELDGLVLKDLYKETVYHDPIESANKISNHLKNEEKCDLIICLSHLGYKYESNKIDDISLAKNTDYIDIILGGHTHTFMDKPDQVPNKSGKPVIINQAGWAGILLGRLDVFFDKDWKTHCVTCNNMIVS